MNGDPLSRQRRLAEVGDAGQARLGAARMLVRGGSQLEELYLRRAGAGQVIADAEQAPEPFVHAQHFAHAASSEVAADAWRALSAIRAVLGLERA